MFKTDKKNVLNQIVLKGQSDLIKFLILVFLTSLLFLQQNVFAQTANIPPWYVQRGISNAVLPTPAFGGKPRRMGAGCIRGDGRRARLPGVK